MPKPARGTGLYFDLPLLLESNESGYSLTEGIKLLVFGGARGDGMDNLESEVYKLSFTLRLQTENDCED